MPRFLLFGRNPDEKHKFFFTWPNKLLVELCVSNNWDLIDNKIIDCSHLNNYGLHLNRKGTGALAKNIKNFLNKN